jgi:hypothetical protein
VVPKSSAVVPGAVDAEPISIHKDHSNMVKFASVDEEGYKKLSGHIALMVGSAQSKIVARWSEYSRIRGTLGSISYYWC